MAALSILAGQIDVPPMTTAAERDRRLLHLPGRRRRPRRADRLLRQAARRARRVRFCMAGFTLQVDFFDHAPAVFTD